MQNATAIQIDSNTTRDLSERNQLITMHLGMALKMARKMARRLPSSVSRDDVESAALLGLTEAATRYDVGREEPFMAFAAKRVRGAILDHLRKNDILSRRARQSARKVAEAARELEGKLGRAATDGEIAAAMGMDEMSFNQTYANVREASVVHLDDLRGELSESLTRGDVAERQTRKAALMQALARLEEREQLVLSCYYGDGLTLREIGAILGVTESRVCQLHTQALNTLRERLS